MNNGVKLRVDSRDRHAHVRFGQVADFQPESNFSFDLYSVIEPETAVSCTAFSTTKVRASQTKVQYDVDDLWNGVPHTTDGADPRDTLGTAIKQGLKDFSDINRDFGLKGYFRADTGSLIDSFDNARSAMALSQSSLMINTYWYSEWNNTPIFGKMPIGKTVVSSHSYVIMDWKIIDGETVFLIDSHQGQKRYMPRDTFNQALKAYGTSTLMPSTQSVLDKRTKTLYETLKDVCINVIILLKQLLIIKQAPITGSIPPKLIAFCEVIRDYEGKPGDLNYQLNNPGDCRPSPVGYLPMYEPVEIIDTDTDPRYPFHIGKFAKFPTYQIGWLYLQNLVKSKVAKNPTQTLLTFMSNYAPSKDKNNPGDYAQYIAKKFNVSVNITMSDLLS